MNPKHSNQNPARSEGTSANAASGNNPNTARAARHSKNPLKRRSEMDLDIPRNTNADLTRVRSLRTPVFTRTRIMVLALALVAALSISGTLAYLAWTTNQTPNRVVPGQTVIKIGEKASLDADSYTYDTDGGYNFGFDKKVVAITAGDGGGQVGENVYVSLVPEAESNQYAEYSATGSPTALSGGYVSFNEEWSALKQETIDGTTWDYIETSVMRVYLAQGWSDKWTFQSTNGVFRYNEVLQKGETTPNLVSGVVLQDSVKASDYKSIKLSVLAQAIQA